MSVGAENTSRRPRTGRQRSATTRLEVGHHSIDRATPREREGVWLLDWSIRLHDGRLVNKRSQGATKGQVRQRAKITAKELLATGGSTWKTTSPLSEYIDQVSRPAIEKAQLRPNSRARYLLALGQLIGDCKTHSHSDSLSRHSIASGTRFRALEACLREIAELHGSESARQARSVLSKYVLQQLNRDEVINGNPLSGMSIDLTSSKRVSSRRGGQALTNDQYHAVLDYLLALEPAEGQTKPIRGRWSLSDRIAKRGNAIELTLLQATTGLRVSEANALTWQHIDTDDDTLHVTVTKSVSKTHRPRRVPVLDTRVTERLLARRNAAVNDSAYVIGAPTDQMAAWDRFNCQKATTQLYIELGESLNIELLNTARTHVWRATLNSLLLDQVPEVVRAAFFGHDTGVNRAAYTDLADTSSMVDAARKLWAV